MKAEIEGFLSRTGWSSGARKMIGVVKAFVFVLVGAVTTASAAGVAAAERGTR